MYACWIYLMYNISALNSSLNFFLFLGFSVCFFVLFWLVTLDFFSFLFFPWIFFFTSTRSTYFLKCNLTYSSGYRDNVDKSSFGNNYFVFLVLKLWQKGKGLQRKHAVCRQSLSTHLRSASGITGMFHQREK